ncbi:pyrin and HIN domain-containing protein 1-like isoform X2 [Choloepus didactylus]|uniref:pyrin and HIN domain-containing protein 1-like isoform X2 n=1 Tax=Choloepus didactylus TaxID=27675 RepID=UPI00189FE068|nr:pyrin and HIN domain-containing protein 1-like isoform X2 [Choloepus didactylus]
MANEYKKIVLLKGLEAIDDYHFNIIKSLLKSDLKLTRKMQEEYNRIQIADLIEEKFPGSASVDKLIELLKDIPKLECLVGTLKNEKIKVKRKYKAKGTVTVQKSPQNQSTTAKSTNTMNEALESESVKDTPVVKFQEKKNKTTKTLDSKRMKVSHGESQLPKTVEASKLQTENHPQTTHASPSTSSDSSLTEKMKDTVTKTDDSKRMMLSHGQSQCPQTSVTSLPTMRCHPHTPHIPPSTPSSNFLSKKRRLKTLPKEASREEGVQRGPKEVMVLNATEPFAYGVSDEERKMFHATVATESEFFQVKVFNVNLKEKFIPKRVIAISDYVGRNGFLELYNFSSVSYVNADQKMEVPNRLIRNANATPKINHLCLQTPGTSVNGVFMVHKKTVRDKCTFYEIQDNTGKMEVVIYGRLTKINCEKGHQGQEKQETPTQS